MKFNTLIFLIIAFNVVMALVRQRAKKAGQRQSRAPEPESVPLSTPSTEGMDLDRTPVAASVEAAVPVVSPILSEPLPVVQKRGLTGPLPRVAEQLRDRHRIQEAFILREILDRPVALRRKV